MKRAYAVLITACLAVLVLILPSQALAGEVEKGGLAAGGVSVQATSGAGYSFDARLYVRGNENYQYAFKVLDKVNKERAKRGLSKLSMDKDLMAAAMQRAAETAILFDHTRPNGKQCFTVCEKMYGENIAAGYSSASSVVNGWMNSSGHRANILDSDFKTIGVGCFIVNGTYYWAQSFGEYDLVKASKRGNRTATHAIDYSRKSGKVSFNVNPTNLRKGKKATLKVRCSDGYFQTPILSKSFKFKSSNTKVVSVNSKGQLVGKKRGKAKVTIAAKKGTYKITKTIKVS